MSERFKQSIDRYYQNRREVEYLDLAIEPVFEIESIEGIKFSCYKKGYKHVYHSEDRQLNLLCDLQLNTLHNLHALFDRINVFSNICLKHFYTLHENLETLEKQLKSFPKQAEFTELINSLIDQPKKDKQETIQLTNQLEKKLEKIELLLGQLHEQWT